MGNEKVDTAENIENPTPTETPAQGPSQEALSREIGEEDIQEKNFQELYEESLKTMEEGNVVKGVIIQVEGEHVLVDIGYKTEGQIPIREFMDSNGNLMAKVGDEVDVLLIRRESKDGVVLSREKAAERKTWEKLNEVYANNGTIRGTIVSKVKGGFSVDIGHQAFLPGSQVDLRPVRDMDSLIGTEHDFKILKYDKRKENIVLSRRAVLEQERKALREQTLERLEEGTVLEGVVKNITPYGLFVDLGGIDGLVHVANLSWGKVGHPSEMYRIDDKVTAKVLSYDKETGKVSLGIKQLLPDPWAEAQTKYPPGTKILGRVVSFKEYGAFVEVEKGLEGLIHVSEMSWTRKIGHPSQVLKVDEMVEAVVLDIDVSKKRISIGMKQAQPNPWDLVAEKYPVGTLLEGKIKNITDFGIFIGIDEGIDGLIHLSDLSWSKRVKNPSEIYKKSQDVQAVVLNIDKEKGRFSLGIKQLTPDPWDAVPEKYSPGKRVTGTVTSVADFGLFVELEEGIEGLVHLSELPEQKGESPLSRFQVDDVIQTEVIQVSQKAQRIGLSIRRMDEKSEKDVYKNYLNNRKEATSNLGELLRKQLMRSED
ncbi:MAG: 30S ribosomal protein S1 [Desulfobacterales bacterium]|nr:30S ribosomal protein S1 [Desulfobacterales bacterium]